MPFAYADMLAALGPITVQPVFSGGGARGWRLYNTDKSEPLRSQGIASGTMVTHVCGVPVSEITGKEDHIPCKSDSSQQFEMTFLVADQPRQVIFKRAAK